MGEDEIPLLWFCFYLFALQKHLGYLECRLEGLLLLAPIICSASSGLLDAAET